MSVFFLFLKVIKNTMKHLFLLSFILILFAGCKKDEKDETTQTNNVTTPPPVTTPTQVSVSVDLYGETQVFVFGENSFSLQFSTLTSIDGDVIALAPQSSMTNLGMPGTEFSGYLSLQLPAALIPAAEFNADPVQAFRNYFAGTEEFVDPLAGEFFVVMADGSSWSTLGTTNAGVASSGDWNMNYVNEGNEFTETIRCHGEVVLQMKNQVTNEIADMEVSYTMKFTEPF